MHRKSWIIVTTLIVAMAAWAGDPWKEKPFDQWDEADIRKIVSDSPWVARVAIPAPWRPASVRDSGGGGYAGAEAAPLEGAAPSTIGAAGQGGQQPQAQFMVRWASSNTIRRALIRGALLRGAINQEQAQEALRESPEEYQLVIVGPDMTPFRGVEEEELAKRTYLRPKKFKVKHAPSRVLISKSNDGQTITSILFSFPKQTANGEPLISKDEKGVEFGCEARASIRTSFDLRKMVSTEGQDL